VTIIVHLARWRSKTDWNITILISADKSAIISVHLVKFGEIRNSDPEVLDIRICTVGIENFTGVTSDTCTFTMGRGCQALQ